MKRRKIFLYMMATLLVIALIAFVGRPLLGLLGSGPADKDNESVEIVDSRLTFMADSAYVYCARQCAFGPRTMNSVAHDSCGEWIKRKFSAFGLVVESQHADIKGYDGTLLRCENIIARLNPEASQRLLLCAHWDSRPWADNDPSTDNHHTPVMGANDGASGVAVMIELARMLTTDSAGISIGIDFVCFDAEDYGTPQWASDGGGSDTWALGAQHWSKLYSERAGGDRPSYDYGILLDMVGGEGARFYREGMSEHFAPEIVDRVWRAAGGAGFSTWFPQQTGSFVTDDHVPVNEVACIPCIDIIPYYPDCPQSSFGPTWHTTSDTMEHISTATLRAVGQTLATLLSEY